MLTPMSNESNRSFFIVFEGGDACGKTTQVEMLVEKLAGLGVVVVKESMLIRLTTTSES